ncbi:MAG: amidohydrolase family protein [Chthonomonadales bacterium]
MPSIIDVNTIFGPLPEAAADLSVDDLTALMHRHSVDACCTLSTIGLLLDHRMGNAATKAACSENPRFIPVATMNPQSFYGGEGPHLRFRADGFKLARFFPGAQGWVPDYEPFIALVRALEAEGLPIMVDVSRPGEATRLVQSLGVDPAPLVLAGVDEQTLAEALVLMRAHPNLYVETSHLLALGAIKHVVEHVGAERVLFGSGAPARPMAGALAVVRHSGVPEEEQSHILGANAARLLGVTLPSHG